MAYAYIYANSEFLLVQPCAGFRRVRANPDEKQHILSPNEAPTNIGASLLEALSKFRKISESEIASFFDLAAIERDYTNWSTSLLTKYGYKNKKAMFQSMKHCLVKLDEGKISIQPTKHEKLEAWGGTGLNGKDIIVVELGASVESIGLAVLAALERCK